MCRGRHVNFIERIYEYCTSGGHNIKYIDTDSALKDGCELVHYKGSGNDTILHMNATRGVQMTMHGTSEVQTNCPHTSYNHSTPCVFHNSIASFIFICYYSEKLEYC